MPTAGGAWVNMRGSLWRCSNEQMRSASNEESQGIEIVNQYLGQMQKELKSEGKGVLLRASSSITSKEELKKQGLCPRVARSVTFEYFTLTVIFLHI